MFWREWARVDPTTGRTAQRIYEAGLAPLSFEPVVGEPDGWYRGYAYRLNYPHVPAAGS